MLDDRRMVTFFILCYITYIVRGGYLSNQLPSLLQSVFKPSHQHFVFCFAFAFDSVLFVYCEGKKERKKERKKEPVPPVIIRVLPAKMLMILILLICYFSILFPLPIIPSIPLRELS